VPKSDLPFLRKIAKGMGWTITSTKKSGIDLGLEDIKAGRVYRAANAEEMLSQILG
jgi:outer membrane biogenesis lipoprotein LolB